MQTRGLLSEEMNKIRRELTLMSACVEEDLGKAITMLHSDGEELAKEVKEGGKKVDALQLKIEDMALVLIATQQPVARDLRELVTVFKITANLERIGDFVIHLAKAAKKMSQRPPFRSVEHIEHMAGTGQEMLKAAFSAFLAQDAEAARKAAGMDDKIDEDHKALTEDTFANEKKAGTGQGRCPAAPAFGVYGADGGSYYQYLRGCYLHDRRPP